MARINKSSEIICPICGNENYLKRSDRVLYLKCQFCKTKMQVVPKSKGGKTFIEVNDVTRANRMIEN